MWLRTGSLVALGILGTLSGSSQEKAHQSTLSCPAAIKVTETVSTVDGWKGGSTTVERSFERVSIYNGKDGDKEYDLAPDDQKEQGKKIVQKWNLKGYRTMNIFMRCRYRDTSAVLSRDLPPDLQTCTFAFEMDAKGNFMGKPVFGCK
jgi:hypothetical protein